MIDRLFNQIKFTNSLHFELTNNSMSDLYEKQKCNEDVNYNKIHDCNQQKSLTIKIHNKRKETNRNERGKNSH